MKTLITGATGFVGSRLTELLVERGDEATCLVRKTSDLRWIENLPVRRVVGELSQPETLKAAMEGQERVFHLAAVLKAPSLQVFDAVNRQGTFNAMQAWTQYGDPSGRFVYCSSLAAAGPTQRGRRIDETHPPRPISDYGTTKLAGEEAVRQLAGGRLSYAVVRPPAVYGPRDTDIRIFFQLIRNGAAPRLGRGDREIDILYVDDLAEALTLAAERPEAHRQTYFVNDGETHTWESMSEGIASALGVRPLKIPIPMALAKLAARASELLSTSGKTPTFNRRKLNEMTQEAWICDASKARRELGFEPKTDAGAGFELTARWYEEHGWK